MLALPRTLLRYFVALAAVLAGVSFASVSAAQIKSPGDHPDYSVELEPHFVLQWENTYYADDGVGLGGRVNFPIIKNGPIRTINNNMAIGVGLDWVHFSGCYGYRITVNGSLYDDCSANQIHIPVVAQWNFFFTPVVSAFAELGLGIRHTSFDIPCAANLRGPYCNGSDTDVEGIFAVGPRFHVADAFAITLRVGYPYLSAGVSFFL